MSIAGTLEVRLLANIAALQEGMNNARRSVSSAMDSIEKTLATVAKSIAAFGAGLSVTATVSKLISVQREFDVLNASLITVTGSSQKAAQEFVWIKQFAATTPFQLNEVTAAFIKMKSLGLEASQKALTSYGNTASAMGTGLNQMIEAVADAATGEFERLKEFGVKAGIDVKESGNQVAMTFQGVTTNIGNNAKEITRYLQSIGEVEFAGAMEERTKTLDGAISNLTDNIDELFRTVNQGGFATALTNDIRTINTELQGLNDTMLNSQKAGESMFMQFANASGFVVGTAAIGLLNGTANTLNWTINALTGGFLGLNENVKLLPESLMTNEQRAASLALKLQAAEVDLANLQAKLALAPNNIYLQSSTYDAYLLTQQLRSAKEAQDRLLGITSQNSQSASRLKAVKEYYEEEEKSQKKVDDLMAKSSSVPDAYIKRMKEIGEANQTGKMSSQQLAIALENAHGMLKKNTSGASAAKKEIKDASDALGFYTNLMDEASGYTKSYAEDQNKLALALRTGAINYDQYSDAAQKLIDKQPGVIAAQKEAEKATKDRVANTVRSINSELEAYYSERKAIEEVEKSLNTLARTNADYADSLDFESGLMGKSAKDRATAIEQYKLLAKYKAEAAKIEATIADPAVRESKLAALAVQQQQAIDNAARNADLTAWTATFDRINDGLTDAIMNAGKDGGKGLRDFLEAEMLTKPFRMVIQALVQPVAQGMTNMVMGTDSGAGSTDLVGAASKAYDMLTNGITKSVERGFEKVAMSSLGESMGLSEVKSITGLGGAEKAISGLTEAGKTLQTGATALAGAATAYGAQKTVSGGYDTAGSGIVDIATAVAGAIFPQFAPVIGAAVGAFNRLFGSSAWEVQSQGIKGNLSAAGNFTGSSYQNLHRDTGWFSNSDSDRQEAAPLAAAQSNYLSTVFKNIKTQTALFAESVGVSSESIKGYTKDLDIAITGDAAANKAAIDKAFNSVADEMASLVGGTRWSEVMQSAFLAPTDWSQYAKVLDDGSTESTSAVLQRLSTAITTVNAAFDLLGVPMFQASLASGDLASKLTEAFGGIDKFSTAIASFYGNFYEESERTAKLTQTTSEAFAKLGFTLPAIGEGTRAWYKDLVNTQLELGKTDEGSAELAASLLALQDPVNELAPAMEQVKSSVSGAAEAAKNYADWQNKLAVASGKTTQSEIDRAAALADGDDATDRLINRYYDLTAATDAASKAQTDATTAQSEAASAQASAASASKAYTDAIQSAADKQADIAAQVEDIGKTDFQKQLAQIKRDAEKQASSLAGLSTAAATAQADANTKTQAANSAQALADAQAKLVKTLSDTAGLEKSIPKITQQIKDLVTGAADAAALEESVPKITEKLASVVDGLKTVDAELELFELGAQSVVTAILSLGEAFSVLVEKADLATTSSNTLSTSVATVGATADSTSTQSDSLNAAVAALANGFLAGAGAAASALGSIAEAASSAAASASSAASAAMAAAGSASSAAGSALSAAAPASSAPAKKAAGGLISGPGTTTSDSIPAMLSHNEFVIQASSVSKYGTDFLSAINAGAYAQTVRRADGGSASGIHYFVSPTTGNAVTWDASGAHTDTGLTPAELVSVLAQIGTNITNALLSNPFVSSVGATIGEVVSDSLADLVIAPVATPKPVAALTPANTPAYTPPAYTSAYTPPPAASSGLSPAELLAYTNQRQSLIQSYRPGQTSAQATAALGASGFNVTDMDQAGINKYFHDLAESADLTTEAGRATIASIEALGQSISTMGAVAQERAGLQDQLDQATMTSAQLLEKQRNGLDESNQELFDNLQLLKAKNQYEDLFMTGQETHAKTVRKITDEFAAVGIELPAAFQGLDMALLDTQEEIDAARFSYRTLIDSIDTTTPAGKQAATALMSVAGALDTIIPAAEKLSRDDSIMKMRQAEKDIFSAIYAIGDLMKGYADDLQSSKDDIREAYFSAQDEMLSAQEDIAALTLEAAKGFSAFNDTIQDFLDKLNNQQDPSEGNLSAQKSRLSATAVLAAGGDKASQDKLLSQAQNVLNLAKSSSMTSVDYARSVAFVQSRLNQVQKTIAPQVALTSAEETPLQKAQVVLDKATLKLADLALLAAATGTSTENRISETTKSLLDLAKAFETSQHVYLTAVAALGGVPSAVKPATEALTESIGAYAKAVNAHQQTQNDYVESQQASLALTTSAAGVFADSLGLSGLAQESFIKYVTTAGLASGIFAIALGVPGTKAEQLATALGLTGVDADNLTARLANTSRTALDLSTAMGMPTSSASFLAEKLGLVSTDASALTNQFAITDTSAQALAESLGLSGDAAKEFVEVLKDPLPGLAQESFIKYVTTAGLASGIFAIALGVPGTKAEQLATALGLTGVDADNLTARLANTSRTALDLSTAMGMPTSSASFLAEKLGLVSTDASALTNQFAITDTSAQALAESLGLSGDAAKEFVEVLKDPLLGTDALKIALGLPVDNSALLAANLGIAKDAAQLFIDVLNDPSQGIAGLATALGSPNANAAELVTQLGYTGESAAKLVKALTDPTGAIANVQALAIAMGDPTANAGDLAIKLGLSGEAAAAFMDALTNPTTGANSSAEKLAKALGDPLVNAESLATKLGLSDSAAAAFVKAIAAPGTGAIDKADILAVALGSPLKNADWLATRLGLAGDKAEDFKTRVGASAESFAALFVSTGTVGSEVEKVVKFLQDKSMSLDDLVITATTTKLDPGTIVSTLLGESSTALQDAIGNGTTTGLSGGLASLLTPTQATTFQTTLTNSGISADNLGKALDYARTTGLVPSLGAAADAIGAFATLIVGVKASIAGREALAAISTPKDFANYVRSQDWTSSGMQTLSAQSTKAQAMADIASSKGIRMEDMSVDSEAWKGWFGSRGVTSLATIVSQFAKGTNYLPSDMFAQVHEGERIVPAADNRALMQRLQEPQQNSRNDEEYKAEIRALKMAVQALQKAADSSAESNKKTANILLRVTQDGNSLKTSAA